MGVARTLHLSIYRFVKPFIKVLFSRSICQVSATMSTKIDKQTITKAYEDIRSDKNETQWGVFIIEGDTIKLSGTGNSFDEFKSSFGDGDRGFGFIRINTGDELSKRAKFVLVTWVGPGVSFVKKSENVGRQNRDKRSHSKLLCRDTPRQRHGLYI